ncbi:MAG TPA: hypothetical protein VGH98_10630 [Gemmatimonadaceae bacterium]
MTKRFLVPCAPLVLVVGAIAAHAGTRKGPIIVHEWGTITTRHAPNGTPQGRLNRIDTTEVLPQFVHRYEPSQTVDNPEKTLVKETLVPGRPDVTMRLETPVIYFYPARDMPLPPPFQVTVRFRGGIVNEFYPDAEASVVVDVERASRKMQTGAIPSEWNGDVLDNYVVGRLLWRDVALAPSASLTPTSSHVWLAPRNVPSTNVTSKSGEAERYLFYRGVAHLDALMQTELLAKEVRFLAPRQLEWMHQPSMAIAKMWLVDIRPNGTVAFREHAPLTIDKAQPSRELARMPLFADEDYSSANLAALRQAMKQSLVGAGLFEPEAGAMLETWKKSYFETPGLRVFYLVPDEWLGYFLPLRVSIPNQLTRVIVGRIDLLRR